GLEIKGHGGIAPRSNGVSLLSFSGRLRARANARSICVDLGTELLHAAFELFRDPGVEAFARERGGEIDSPMQVRADTGHELAGEWLFRLLSSLRAKGQVVRDGIVECFLQFGDRGPLKGNHIPSVDDFAVENCRFVVVLDASNVSLIFHHGVTPASV